VSNNISQLVYFADPARVVESLKVRRLLDGGVFGDDLTALFEIVEVDGGVVQVKNVGDPLANESWIGITDNCGLNIQYDVVYGDANGDGTTDAQDMNLIWTNRGAAANDSPFDMDGDGNINALDINNAWHFRNSAAPDKPTGHDCSK
jgi:hypothetical protein